MLYFYSSSSVPKGPINNKLAMAQSIRRWIYNYTISKMVVMLSQWDFRNILFETMLILFQLDTYLAIKLSEICNTKIF